MQTHILPCPEIDLIYILGRHCFLSPVPLTVPAEPGDYVRLQNEDATEATLPELRCIIGVIVQSCRAGDFPVLLTPGSLMRQGIFSNRAGKTFVFWVRDSDELEVGKTVHLNSLGDWTVEGLCTALRPEDIPSPANLAYLEEVNG